MSDKILSRSTPMRHDFFEKQGDLLERLAREGQEPEALFICCSDSRISPEALLGALPGDFFMLRNVANIVPPYSQTEIGIASALEFAVLHLHVPHLILCGHTDCGGIKAVDTKLNLSKEPSLSRWVDLARPAQREVDAFKDHQNPEERHLAIVERNVVHQLQNLQSYPFIRQAIESSQLELHGWVYYLKQRRIKYYDPETDQFIAP